MSKVQFIQSVESLFASNEVSPEVRLYFEQTVKAKKVNKKEQQRAETVKQAILDYLISNAGMPFDRVQIGDAIHNSGIYAETMLLNDKQTGVAYNSITAYANQLVATGEITKFEQKVGKSKRVFYKV
jgi:hypothetical protein